MTLSGNLGFVSLEEILLLLTRSNQQGRVDVRAESARGRVYLGREGIQLAATADDSAVQELLIKAEIVSEELLRRVEAGEATLASVGEESRDGIVALLREITVESLYQLGRSGGDFDVVQGDVTPYASPRPFDLNTLLTDVRQRAADWQEVRRRVPDLTSPVTFVRDLEGREELKISGEAWRVLSEIGRGSSVRDMAAELGTTEFWTARVTAQLLDDGLVQTVAGGAWQAGDVRTGEVQQADEPPAPHYEPSAGFDPSAEVDPDQSWWKEPEKAPEGEPEEEPEKAIEEEPVRDQHAIDEPAADPFFQEAGGEEGQPIQIEPFEPISEEAELEEDTEAFLEKVFSELEPEEEEPKEEREEGYGLLRRRRMGSMRDLSGD